MIIPASRDEQIENFYREHAARLHRGICGRRSAWTTRPSRTRAPRPGAAAGRPDIDLERYEAYWGGGGS